MKNKNILQIFASSEWGGGEQYVYNITKKLLSENNNVICVSRESAIISNKLSSLNVTHYILNLNGIYDIKSAYQLKDIIVRHNIEIIHIHNFKTSFTAIYAKKISGRDVKIILTRHLVKKARNNHIYNNLYKSLDTIIFVSNLAKNEFLSTNSKIDKSKCKVLFNSVLDEKLNNDNTFDTVNLKERFNIPSNNKIILYSGRLHQENGLEILLEAINKVENKNFMLILAGTGNTDYVNKLQNIVKDNKLQDKVVFLGFQENIEPIIKQCSFGVTPTIVKEAFGLSNIEFMKCGKAVITTNNGAQPEYITNMVNGILINPNNSEELSKKISLLLTNEELSNEIGLKAQLFFNKNLKFDLFYSKLIKIYQES
ncbi:MAG: glycosyltransferase family 4 protein [Bacteroidales bacterium]|jgi:glycosyltransferase involved in cell wall biosynthesis